MITDAQLYELAERVGHALHAKGWTLATAESCTGGWVAQAVTAVPGSSAWFERGFVTYTNIAKQEMLGVQRATLDAHGAVSEPAAREMGLGALAHSHARVAIAITGIAGPSDGHPNATVGTVCFGWGERCGDVQTITRHFDGEREAVRRQAVGVALELVMALAAGAP